MIHNDTLSRPNISQNEQISFFYVPREKKANSSRHYFDAHAVSSIFALRVTLLTELCIKREPSKSQCLYLEVDLLGQFFSLVVLGAGVAVGGQSQEGRAHGATTRLTAEVLGPAGEQSLHGEVTMPQEHLSFYITFRHSCLRQYQAI